MSSKKKSRKKLIITIFLILVVLALFIVPLLLRRGTAYTEEKVTKGDIETYFTFSGNVESKNSQNVMAEKPMQISEIKVAKGDKVVKDTVLFVTSQKEEIKSKIAGTVSQIYIEDDETVMSGTKLCDIVDFENLQITVKVDEYDLSSIAVDKEVTVTIGAIDKEVSGKIASISDTAVNQNGVAYFTAVVNLTKDDAIKVGMTAEAKILNKSVKNVLTIPVKALQFDENDKPYVLVKGDKNILTKTTVEVGVNDGKKAEIKSGLSEGQTVAYQKEESEAVGFRRVRSADSDN